MINSPLDLLRGIHNAEPERLGKPDRPIAGNLYPAIPVGRVAVPRPLRNRPNLALAAIGSALVSAR